MRNCPDITIINSLMVFYLHPERHSFQNLVERANTAHALHWFNNKVKYPPWNVRLSCEFIKPSLWVKGRSIIASMNIARREWKKKNKLWNAVKYWHLGSTWEVAISGHPEHLSFRNQVGGQNMSPSNAKYIPPNAKSTWRRRPASGSKLIAPRLATALNQKLSRSLSLFLLCLGWSVLKSFTPFSTWMVSIFIPP